MCGSKDSMVFLWFEVEDRPSLKRYNGQMFSKRKHYRSYLSLIHIWIIALDGETELPFVFEPPGSGEELVASEHMAVVWKNGKCGCVEIVKREL